MSDEYKPINNLWKDSEGYRYFGTLKLSSKIKYDSDDFIPLWEWVEQLQQENKILKENAENNDKVVDKVNWENQQLKNNINKLQKELNEENLQCSKYSIEFNNLKEKNKQLKEVIDKNIVYINQHWVIDEPVLFKNDLLEILEDKEV